METLVDGWNNKSSFTCDDTPKIDQWQNCYVRYDKILTERGNVCRPNQKPRNSIPQSDGFFIWPTNLLLCGYFKIIFRNSWSKYRRYRHEISTTGISCLNEWYELKNKNSTKIAVTWFLILTADVMNAWMVEGMNVWSKCSLETFHMVKDFHKFKTGFPPSKMWIPLYVTWLRVKRH